MKEKEDEEVLKVIQDEIDKEKERESQEVQKVIQEEIDTGVITESTLIYNSRAYFIKKNQIKTKDNGMQYL